MTTQEVTYPELEKAIRIAFQDDTEIFKYYDKNVIVTNLDELVTDIMRKLKEYPPIFPDTVFKIVQEKNQIVGYIVYKEETLISFSLSVKYRQRKYLRAFFSLIRNELKGRFYCTLWSRNIRAVKYLCKNGMKIIDTNPHLTKLVNP